MIHPYKLDYRDGYMMNQNYLLLQALYKLGRKRAIAPHGAGGMDEATYLEIILFMKFHKKKASKIIR